MLDIQDSTETGARYDVRILVVDDDALARFIVADQLEALGCRRVDTAADGIEALRLALDCSYDLVITDLCMPKMGGQALLAALRTHGLAVPVVAGTAWREPPSARASGVSSRGAVSGEAPPHGFAAVLRKPFAMTQLRRLLHAHIDGSRFGRRRIPAPASPRRALHAAFALAWSDDERALRTALASLDAEALLGRLHRLHGALSMLGEARARNACVRLQQRIRWLGIEASAAQIEGFLTLCARIGRD
ncbi:Hpt domain-containing response regulator [Trinickia dinghuensis]|nr:response regulator [Trinickia dinghuensis]